MGSQRVDTIELSGYVPAGRTVADVHDPLVSNLRSLGLPDSIANVPTIIPSYVAAGVLEILRTLGLVKQPEESQCN